MSLAPGARLGPYEIIAAIGAGGMGEVYRARDARLGRDVAIKVIPAAFSADSDRLRRFEHEARAAAALNHPNILAVFDIGSYDGAPYVVAELLEGETLRERLHAGALPVRKVVEYGIQVAHGLAAAHEKGIVHRDLKPENLFITADGRVKILDFGLAKLTQTDSPLISGTNAPTTPVANQTQAGMVLGTIGYMAPEQVRGQTVDHRADVFAFGTILYEMLSGQRAFHGQTTIDTMTAILKEDPPDLPLAERHIPPALDRMVHRCLEKNPTARFQTASDLAFALEGLEIGPAMPAMAAHRAGRWSGWIAAAISTVLLLAASVPAVLYLRQRPVERMVSRFEIVTPPTGDPLSFALSLDGRQLAYVANTEAGLRLWVRRFEDAAAKSLPGTEGASYPFWSPDGRAIGFFADAKLKRVDLAGGTVQVLAAAATGRGGSWSRDDVILFAQNTVGGLMRVPAAGGTPSEVTHLAAGENSHRWPQFLPDGHHFLFGMSLGRVETRGTYLGSLDGGAPTRLLPDEVPAVYAAPGVLLAVRQGVLMALKFNEATLTVSGEPVPVSQNVGADTVLFRGGFTVSATGVLAQRAIVSQRRQLVWLDRAGHALGPVAEAEDAGLAGPALSPDGERVAVLRSVQGNIDIWIFDVRRGVPSRFTFHSANESTPVWSPDGRSLVFRSNRNGVYDLFEKPANGAGDEQPLVVSSENKAPVDWSADGRVLLYTSLSTKTSSDIWALPSGGDKKPFAVLQTAFDETDPHFSPDGKWMAYESNESGRMEVYVRPFPGPGGQWQFSTAGGTQIRWRADGKELFYVSADGHLMAAPVVVTPDGRGLQPGAPVSLFAARLASGGNIVIPGYAGTPQYAVARDGRFLANVAAEGEIAPPISVVLNWDAALKR